MAGALPISASAGAAESLYLDPELAGDGSTRSATVNNSGDTSSSQQPPGRDLTHEDDRVRHSPGTPSLLLQPSSDLPPQSREQSTHQPAQQVQDRDTRVARPLQSRGRDPGTDRQRTRFLRRLNARQSVSTCPIT